MKKKVITKSLIHEFEKTLQEEEKSRSTIEKYMRDIRKFDEFVSGRDIDKKVTLEYKEWLEKEYALTSANSMIVALNSFFKFAGWYECCIKQFKIQKKTYCSENSELTKQEYFLLVQQAEKSRNKRLSLLIQTICCTGIRVSEIRHITVEAVKQGEAIVSCKGKSRKVFIISELCKRLLKYAKKNNLKSGMIFLTRNGKPLDRSNIWREMKTLCKQAGISGNKVFPHNLRHLFARTFYEIEKDIAKLADILGHSSINTTRVYIISTGIEHKRKLERMKLII